MGTPKPHPLSSFCVADVGALDGEEVGDRLRIYEAIRARLTDARFADGRVADGGGASWVLADLDEAIGELEAEAARRGAGG